MRQREWPGNREDTHREAGKQKAKRNEVSAEKPTKTEQGQAMRSCNPTGNRKTL